MLEPGIRARPGQFSQFLSQGTKTNSTQEAEMEGPRELSIPRPARSTGQSCLQTTKNKKWKSRGRREIRGSRGRWKEGKKNKEKREQGRTQGEKDIVK